MSDDYTPDEKTAREAWCEFLYLQSHGMKHVDDSGAEFDRLIAKVKADAWDECAARARGDMEAELAAANPYKKEVAQ